MHTRGSHFMGFVWSGVGRALMPIMQLLGVFVMLAFLATLATLATPVVPTVAFLSLFQLMRGHVSVRFKGLGGSRGYGGCFGWGGGGGRGPLEEQMAKMITMMELHGEQMKLMAEGTVHLRFEAESLKAAKGTGEAKHEEVVPIRTRGACHGRA